MLHFKMDHCSHAKFQSFPSKCHPVCWEMRVASDFSTTEDPNKYLLHRLTVRVGGSTKVDSNFSKKKCLDEL
jgi:hypothetical protein